MVTALQFSGGKDSLACLHLFKNHPEAVVLFADTGSSVPGVREYVHKTVADLGLPIHIVRPPSPCDEWQNEMGYPSDIVPVDAAPLMRVNSPGKYHPIVPYSACCERHIWRPLMDGIKEIGATVVVRGSKGTDHKISVGDGYVEDGVVFRSPLWTWTDDDVFAYLESVGAELPPQYSIENADSLDCWCCTAYMDAAGAARYEFMKKFHPAVYKKAKSRMDVVAATIRAAVDEMVFDV